MTFTKDDLVKAQMIQAKYGVVYMIKDGYLFKQVRDSRKVRGKVKDEVHYMKYLKVGDDIQRALDYIEEIEGVS